MKSSILINSAVLSGETDFLTPTFIANANIRKHCQAFSFLAVIIRFGMLIVNGI